LASYQEKLEELTELGATVIAASVENLETTLEMEAKYGLTFPVAYGVTEEQIEDFHPLMNEDHHGRYIQPMEFMLLRDGTVFGSMYASGPVGRMGADEVINSIKIRERRRLEREAEAAEAAKEKP
jgi:peroxiredoxin